MSVTGKEKVLKFLEENWPATDEEIAEGCGMSPSSARTRRHELEIEGLIEPVGRTKSKYGRETFLWCLASKLKEIRARNSN